MVFCSLHYPTSKSLHQTQTARGVADPPKPTHPHPPTLATTSGCLRYRCGKPTWCRPARYRRRLPSVLDGIQKGLPGSQNSCTRLCKLAQSADAVISTLCAEKNTLESMKVVARINLSISQFDTLTNLTGTSPIHPVRRNHRVTLRLKPFVRAMRGRSGPTGQTYPSRGRSLRVLHHML